MIQFDEYFSDGLVQPPTRTLFNQPISAGGDIEGGSQVGRKLTATVDGGSTIRHVEQIYTKQSSRIRKLSKEMSEDVFFSPLLYAC